MLHLRLHSVSTVLAVRRPPFDAIEYLPETDGIVFPSILRRWYGLVCLFDSATFNRHPFIPALLDIVLVYVG